MRPINMKRVSLGGLAAGVVINVSETILNVPVLGGEMKAALAKLNLPALGSSAIATFVVMSFVLGVALVWLYAAIRPRFGPGPRTAAIAGLAVWFMAYLYGSLGMGVMGFLGTRLLTISTLWGLVEVLVAAQVGGWLYSEPRRRPNNRQLGEPLDRRNTRSNKACRRRRLVRPCAAAADA